MVVRSVVHAWMLAENAERCTQQRARPTSATAATVPSDGRMRALPVFHTTHRAGRAGLVAGVECHVEGAFVQRGPQLEEGGVC
eukprot:1420414-Pleurochrysis_carterae.AAC.3